MLTLLCALAAGIACGVGSVVFVVLWWLWPRRTDGLAKPGGAITCRLAQSALFAGVAALLWWTAPLVGIVLLVAHCRRRRAPSVFDWSVGGRRPRICGDICVRVCMRAGRARSTPTRRFSVLNDKGYWLK